MNNGPKMRVNNPRQIVQLVAQALAVNVGSAAFAFNAFAQQAPASEKVGVMCRG